MSDEEFDQQMHNSSIASWYADLAAKIAQYGVTCIGVFGSEDDPSPPFTYTIGLSPKTGYELIIVGLRIDIAHHLLNTIAAKLLSGDTLQLDVPDDKWANMPLVFKETNAAGREFAFQAAQYYDNKELKVVQLVMPDKCGYFPWDHEYDHAFMDVRQTLLF